MTLTMPREMAAGLFYALALTLLLRCLSASRTRRSAASSPPPPSANSASVARAAVEPVYEQAFADAFPRSNDCPSYRSPP
jgi:hypothetical protein